MAVLESTLSIFILIVINSPRAEDPEEHNRHGYLDSSADSSHGIFRIPAAVLVLYVIKKISDKPEECRMQGFQCSMDGTCRP